MPQSIFDISLVDEQDKPRSIFDIDLSDRERDKETRSIFDIDLSEKTPTGLPSLVDHEPYIPKYKEVDDDKHVGALERFGKRFAEYFTPFAMYDPELPEPEGFREALMGALGGAAGFVMGTLPLAFFTGGASIPLSAASKVSSASKTLTTAYKVGGKKMWDRTARQLVSTARGTSRMEPEMLISGKGALGRMPSYRRGLQRIASRGPAGVKWAKAADLGLRNFITFAGYGQTHMKPDSPMEQRWSQLKADTITSALFTGIASPSSIIYHGTTGLKKAGIIGAESFTMFGMGAYSDLGKSDMSWEERMAHGFTLSAMHGVMKGLDREGIKSQQMETLRQHGLSEQDAYRYVYKFGTSDAIIDNANKVLKDDPSLFIDNKFYSKPGLDMGDYLVRVVRSDVKHPQSGKPSILYEKFYGKEVGDQFEMNSVRTDYISGTTLDKAIRNFNKKFTRLERTNVKEREPRPEGLTKEQIDKKGQFYKESARVRKAIVKDNNPVERFAEIVETGIKKDELGRQKVNPVTVKQKTVLEDLNIQHDKLSRKISNLKLALKEDINLVGFDRNRYSPSQPEHWDALAGFNRNQVRMAGQNRPMRKEIRVFYKAIDVFENKLKELNKEIEGTDFLAAKEYIGLGELPEMKRGDFVKIPVLERTLRLIEDELRTVGKDFDVGNIYKTSLAIFKKTNLERKAFEKYVHDIGRHEISKTLKREPKVPKRPERIIGKMNISEAGVGEYVATLNDVVLAEKGRIKLHKSLPSPDELISNIIRLDVTEPATKIESMKHLGNVTRTTIRNQNTHVFKTVENTPGEKIRYVALHENQIKDIIDKTPYNRALSEKISSIFNINFGKPYMVNLLVREHGKKKWSAYRDTDIIHDKPREGFDSIVDAINWKKKYWDTGVESDRYLMKLASDKKSAGESIKGTPEFQQWERDFRGTSALMDKVGMSPKTDAGKEFIKMYFPENKTGNIKDLNSRELTRLRSQIPENLNIDVLPGEPGSVYPTNVMNALKNTGLRKYIHLYSGLLANHTIFEGGGKGLSLIGKLTKGYSFTFRSRQGQIQRASEEVARVMKRKDKLISLRGISKKDLKNIVLMMDDKFKEIRGTDYDKFIEKYSGKIKYEDPVTGKTQHIKEHELIKKILRDYFDNESVEKARANVRVVHSETGKLEPYLEIFDNYGNKIPIDKISPDVKLRKISVEKIDKDVESGKISPEQGKKLRKKALKSKARLVAEKPQEEVILSILNNERKAGDKVRVRIGYDKNTKQDKYKSVTIGEVTYNHHNPNYLPRLITDQFFELFHTNENFRKTAAREILNKHPELNAIDKLTIPGPDGTSIKLRGEEARLMAAELMLKDLQDLYSSNRVYGQEHTRLANLDPYMYFDNMGNRIIPNTLVDKVGNPFKKGDSVDLLGGGKSVVDKSVKVYETNFKDLVDRHSERSARSIAAYRWFDGTQGLIEGQVPKMITLMRREIKDSKLADWYEQYTKKVTRDMVFGQDISSRGEMGRLFAQGTKKITRASASIGLSFPASGFKNLMLGQIQLATHFHMKDLFKTYYDLLVNPAYRAQMKDFATQVGARYTGSYDLFLSPSKALRALQWTGGMKATEMTNRIISVAMAKRSLELHLDNLLGRGNKVISPSKSQSRHVLQEVFDFTPNEITRMLDKRETHGRRPQQASFNPGYTNEQLMKTADRAHTITQGIGDYPYVPYWMGKDWARPMTLFYRIAYRMTNNIANNVIKPAVNDGNIVPMMKYVGLSLAAGETLYSLYYHMFGEERRNQFKDAPAQYWSNFVRAEGLGVMSNAFDEHGNTFADVYTPVVLRNFFDLTGEALNFVEGKKKFKQSRDDLLKKTVALYGGVNRIVQNATGDTKKRVINSRRRQRQFNDAYFPDWDSPIDGNDGLTRRTPYYRAMRDIFWYDNEELKAREYYTALAYVTNQLQRSDSALAKNDYAAEKEARSILKSIISRLRPIPSSWRKRGRGERTSKYNLFLSKLKEKDVLEEMELDKMYKTKKIEFWQAINKYRSNYYWK